MEKLMILVIIAFFVQSAFVVALLFRVKRIEKAGKLKDSIKKSVYYDIKAEERES